jgi:hypothetical protein
MAGLLVGCVHHAPDVPCQRQQRASRNARHRGLHLWRVFQIGCGAPDQAPATVRQGNGDEAGATGTGKREHHQTLAG